MGIPTLAKTQGKTCRCKEFKGVFKKRSKTPQPMKSRFVSHEMSSWSLIKLSFGDQTQVLSGYSDLGDPWLQYMHRVISMKFLKIFVCNSTIHDDYIISLQTPTLNQE